MQHSALVQIGTVHYLQRLCTTCTTCILCIVCIVCIVCSVGSIRTKFNSRRSPDWRALASVVAVDLAASYIGLLSRYIRSLATLDLWSALCILSTLVYEQTTSLALARTLC